MDSYPISPGYKGGETSLSAAQAMASTAGTIRDQVLGVIQRWPSTPEEIARDLGIDLYTVRPRVSELKRLGKIQDSGDRRMSRGGKSAIVWQAL